ncbi:hypothetical protein CBR_g18911 [Chara braunii]|uniref:RNA-directed DNA polymerase n=1 Tax=Chara braunii TaxID=69332 RepID=A0A388KWT4_CHABU|nr:hypothetical protein CBR_g18911 [Chara braunii]|eukprot:GBG74501.1 hypothetical protein CBR_g18911 [Chara braunii]
MQAEAFTRMFEEEKFDVWLAENMGLIDYNATPWVPVDDKPDKARRQVTGEKSVVGGSIMSNMAESGKAEVVESSGETPQVKLEMKVQPVTPVPPDRLEVELRAQEEKLRLQAQAVENLRAELKRKAEHAQKKARRKVLIGDMQRIMSLGTTSQASKDMTEFILLQDEIHRSYFTNWDDRISGLETSHSALSKKLDDISAQLSNIAKQLQITPVQTVPPSFGPSAAPVPKPPHSRPTSPPLTPKSPAPSQSSAPFEPQRPKLTSLPMFSGEDPKVDVADWVIAQRTYPSGFKCDEDVKVSAILARLERTALKWCTSTSNKQGMEMADWAQRLGVAGFLQALQDRFADKEQARKAADKIMCLGQKKFDGSLSKLYSTFESLTSTPGLEMSEQDLVIHFLRAAPEQFQLALFSQGHKDWRSFGRAALDVESKVHVQEAPSEGRKGPSSKGRRRRKGALFAAATSGSDSDAASQGGSPPPGTASSSAADPVLALVDALMGLAKGKAPAQKAPSSRQGKGKGRASSPGAQRVPLPRDVRWPADPLDPSTFPWHALRIQEGVWRKRKDKGVCLRCEGDHFLKDCPSMPRSSTFEDSELDETWEEDDAQTIADLFLSLQEKKHKSELILLRPYILGAKIKGLLDCGATRNFISPKAVNKLHLDQRLVKLQQPLEVRIGDSSTVRITTAVKGLPVSFDKQGEVRHRLNFYVFPNVPFDLVFSMQWLGATNPRIDWRIPRVELPDRHGVYRPCILADEYHPTSNCYCMSARKFLRFSHQTDHARLFVAYVKQTDVETAPCPSQIQQVVDRFSDLMEEPTGLVHRQTKHKIEILSGSVPPKGQVYKMSPAELEELKKQLETLTSKGWIRPSTSEFGAPVLFVPKGNGEFRMCVEYRGLNKITRKSTEPLPRIDDMLDMVQGCTIFSKIDLKSGYHQIEMAEGDVHKTAFKTRYGTYEYLVMPFGLCNAPGTFQTEMHRILRPYLDKFVVVYLDDILVFSRSVQEHAQHLALVLQALRANQYKINREKSSFGVLSVIYLGHVISGEGLAPEATKVAAVQDWPRPANIRHVRSFLGLASYYRTFIKNFSAIAAPLTDLTKNFLSLDDDGNVLQPIEYMSKKIKAKKLQDSTYEKELYALVSALKHWKHFLLGRHFKIFSDHSTLQWMKSQGELNDKLARYIQFIDMFDFELRHKKGCYNRVADALSRRPDAFFLISFTHSFGERTRQTIAHLLPQDEIFGPIVRNLQDDPAFEPGYSLVSGLLYTCSRGEERLCIPQDRKLRTLLMSECHDARGHFGALKSYAALSQRFFWKGMRSDMLHYVGTCELCQRNKVVRRPPLGLLKPLPIPDAPAQSVPIDFTDLGRTTPRGMRQVMVCVDRFSKYAEFIPLPAEARVSAVQAAFADRWVTHHGPPTSIVSDRDPHFCSNEWQSYCRDYLHSRLDMTSGRHPEANGQAEVMNQILFQLLRPVISPDHQDWDLHLSRAQLVYNTSVHSSTGFTPYRLHWGREPRQPVDDIIDKATPTLTPGTAEFTRRYRVDIERARANLLKAQKAMIQQANKHRRPSTIRTSDWVWVLSSELSREEDISPKLLPRYMGPWQVSFKYPRRICVYGTEVTVMQQKTRPKDFSHCILEEIMLLKDVPFGDYFQVHVRKEMFRKTDAMIGVRASFDPKYMKMSTLVDHCQDQDSGRSLQPVEYMSKKIKVKKLQDSTYEKELYALVSALKHWKHFLMGRHFQIFSDHSTLQWMKTQGELNDKLARYIQFIDLFDFELKHKNGCYNRVADALSRRPDALCMISSTHTFGEGTRQTIAQLLPQDPTFGPVVRNLQTDPASEPGYILVSDLLYTCSRGEGRLCIPQDRQLRTLMMSECHDARGHFGSLKSLAALSQQFFWPEMRKDMLHYVETCELCQRNKVVRRPPLGLLQPLPIPEAPAQSVSIDFTDLGRTTPRGMRQVMVCVDRFFKYAKFIPLPEEARVPSVRAAFADRGVTHHGPPTSIVSDRNPRFCSNEWQSYCKDYLHSRLNMTSGHHPEANGQAEVMNQILFQLLRSVISPDQQDWDLHLGRAQLVYNTSVHSSTGFTPYRLHWGREPRQPLDDIIDKATPRLTPGTAEFTRQYQRDIERARVNLLKAQKAMIQQANKHHQPSPIRAGDWVWVLSSELSQEEDISPKLLPRYIGPWQVLDTVGADPFGPSYHVDVPLHLQTYPVFHASKLLPFTPADAFPNRPPQFGPPIPGKGYEVEEVVDEYGTGPDKEYLVKFLYQPHTEDRWFTRKELLKTAKSELDMGHGGVDFLEGLVVGSVRWKQVLGTLVVDNKTIVSGVGVFTRHVKELVRGDRGWGRKGEKGDVMEEAGAGGSGREVVMGVEESIVVTHAREEVSKGHVGFVGEGGCKIFVAYSLDAGDERKVGNDGGGEVMAEGADVLDEAVRETGLAEVTKLFEVVIDGFLGVEGGSEKVGPLEEGVMRSSGGAAVADFGHPPFGGIAEEAGGGNGKPVDKGHVVELERVMELGKEEENVLVGKSREGHDVGGSKGTGDFPFAGNDPGEGVEVEITGGSVVAGVIELVVVVKEVVGGKLWHCGVNPEESERRSDMVMEDWAMVGEEGVDDVAGAEVEAVAADVIAAAVEAAAAAAAAAAHWEVLVWRGGMWRWGGQFLFTRIERHQVI